MEHVLAEILLRCVFKEFLETIETEIEELLGVLLDTYVNRITVVFFEGEAELVWVVLLTVGHL